MSVLRSPWRFLFAGSLALGGAALAFGARGQPGVNPTPQPSECTAWEVEYKLSAKLRLSETPLGAGDGTYGVGPGAVVLRFENRGGKPAGTASMLAYRMRDDMTVTARTLLVTTKVTTRANTRATPNQCGSAAEGSLAGATLRWVTPVRGYRTDGTITCEGFLCGKFGAPPAGTSQLHIGPGPVRFRSFDFSENLKRLKMDYAFVAKTDSPQQTAHVALSGTEVRRSCVRPPTCK